MKTDSAKRMLIVKLSAIGDVIHTLPCLNALRQAHPEAEIGWVVQEPAAELLRHHPQLDHLIIFPRKAWGKSAWRMMKEAGPFIRQLRAYKFDVAIDFQGLTKSGLLAWLSGAKTRIGFGDKDGRELNKLFTNVKITPEPERRHIIERNLALLKPLGAALKTCDAVLPIPQEDCAFIESFFQESGLGEQGPPVAIYPGAGWPTKRWPLDCFAKLGVRIAKELHQPVLIVWGPGEEAMAQEIAREMRAEGAEPFLAPPTSLLRLAALLDRCALAVGGDTGPLHLAAALHTPCVGIFGASDAARNRHYVQREVTVQKNELDCVPCWKTECPNQPSIKCLHTITVDNVFQAVRSLTR
jgi:lipopolysaccharide heptosyltransferase I